MTISDTPEFEAWAEPQSCPAGMEWEPGHLHEEPLVTAGVAASAATATALGQVAAQSAKCRASFSEHTVPNVP